MAQFIIIQLAIFAAVSVGPQTIALRGSEDPESIPVVLAWKIFFGSLDSAYRAAAADSYLDKKIDLGSLGAEAPEAAAIRSVVVDSATFTTREIQRTNSRRSDLVALKKAEAMSDLELEERFFAIVSQEVSQIHDACLKLRESLLEASPERGAAAWVKIKEFVEVSLRSEVTISTDFDETDQEIFIIMRSFKKLP